MLRNVSAFEDTSLWRFPFLRMIIVTNSNCQVTTQNMLTIIVGGILIRAGGWKNFQHLISGGTAIRDLRVSQHHLKSFSHSFRLLLKSCDAPQLLAAAAIFCKGNS